MYETIKRLYKSGKLTDNGLKKAVENGWITEKQMSEILKDADGVSE